jgi:hypothetical protein
MDASSAGIATSGVSRCSDEGVVEFFLKKISCCNSSAREEASCEGEVLSRYLRKKRKK